MSQIAPLDYRNSALIVWDMQRRIALQAFNFRQIVPNIKKLIDIYHSAKMPVIYSQHTNVPYEYMTKPQIRSSMRRGIDPKTTQVMMENTPEWQFIDELPPSKQDLVVKKYSSSFFVGTMIDTMLRAKNVDTLVIVGVSTEFGVEATARHANQLGYFSVVVEDAVGSADMEMHEGSLRLMRKIFDVVRSQDIINALK